MTPERLSNLRDLWPHLSDIERELLEEIERLQAELAESNQYNAQLNVKLMDLERQLTLRADGERHYQIQSERLEKELEQAKSQQVHCAACGGVECHRLAEIVKLTGMESDQHLVEWVEQAIERSE